MYNYKKIEAKWRNYWEENQTYKFDNNSEKELLYCLEMFSYPSGAKLHMGHWYNFGVTDTWARFKRMQGYNVFHPMGFDAFGLPAENYAIKTGIHPYDSTMKNIDTMERQIKAMGATYDWNYEVITCREDYYKWTQWMFLQMYKHGLAYKKEAPVNFCPSCHTVLANEQVVNGCCERCDTMVERKKLSQWFFKITDYADELLTGLDKLDWPERTKSLQRNWIGKSSGAMVTFQVDKTDLNFEVFTTRVDTLFGCTYCVIAPEHELVTALTTNENKDQVDDYVKKSSQISEIDRLSTTKEKTGVFTGSYAINPVNGKKVPIWVSDYVIATYGTGVVMAVPAHDERDYAFAKKFKLDIIPVIESDVSKEPYIGAGKYINSEYLNDLTDIKTAQNKVIDNLGNKAYVKDNYRLRDWLISRQRYWGAPIPIVYCDHCGTVAVSETDLPVKLPYNVEFKPDGVSPLAKSDEFLNCVCPKCGRPAKREADTLDTFVCSSWYFLRYPEAHNEQTPFTKETVNKFLPVDKYVGGVEHACMHLLYARFFVKALRDMGYLNFNEPFQSLVHQGVILGIDGEKMSKSKGNTVAPDEYIEEYSADILRTYLMFAFNYIDGGPWSDEGIKAIDRFFGRVVRLIENYQPNDNSMIPEIDFVLHNTIKNITIDTERFQFNTSISRIMEYVNILTKYETKNPLPKYYLEQLVLLLAPFAPHLTEELWQDLGNEPSIHNQSYPKYDASKLKQDNYEMVVQVNGKVRGKITVSIDATKDEMKAKALEIDNVKRYIEAKIIVKTIIVPKKLVNIVIK